MEWRQREAWPMGTFIVDVWLASPSRPEQAEPHKLLVDTGSAYTWVSAASLQRMGVEPNERRRVLTIDGKVNTEP